MVSKTLLYGSTLKQNKPPALQSGNNVVSIVGLKNCTDGEILVITKSGKEKVIISNEIAPLQHIVQISINGNKYEVTCQKDT